VVVRDGNAIRERLAGCHVQEDVVAIVARRDVQPVEMEIRRLLETIAHMRSACQGESP